MALGLRLREETEKIKQEIFQESFDKSFYGFIGLNSGCGTKTIAVNTAVELTKLGHKVCLLDCNVFQPGICHVIGNALGKEESISRYLNSSTEKDEIFKPVKGIQNLWLISASPIDFPLEYKSIDKKLYEELMEYIKESFDYVIAYMPYHPFSETFVCTLDYLDKGYFVWDEQVDCSIKTKLILDFVFKIKNKLANKINNVILNKATRREYSMTLIKNAECDLIAEFPFTDNIPLAKNKGTIYDAKATGDKMYLNNMKLLLDDITKGQKAVKK